MKTPKVTKTENGYKIVCGKVDIYLFEPNHIFVIGATSNEISNRGAICTTKLDVTESWNL